MTLKINSKDLSKIKTIKLSGDIESIREQGSSISINEPGICCLNWQPGVGKTHKVKESLKDEKSFMVVTATHKLINEEYGKLGAKQWKNLKERCAKYDQIKRLHENRVPINVICELKGCDKRKCPYWKQFNTKKAVAPFHYLSTNRVLGKKGEKKGKFKFDVLVVDEAMKGYREIKSSKEELLRYLDIIGKYNGLIEPIKEYLESIEGYMALFFFIDEFKHEILRFKNSALRRAINKRAWNDVKLIAGLDVFQVWYYFHYCVIYGERESFSQPYIYHVFDLAREGVPVTLLDASFDKKAFEIYLARYIYEDSKWPRSYLIDEKLDKGLSKLSDLEIRIYETELQNKDITIYRMDKNNFYYKSGFCSPNSNELSENGKKAIYELRRLIKFTKRACTNVGIITYEFLEKHFSDLGETDHFFNLRGSNKLKNVEALFIIGTPKISKSDCLKQYNELCLSSIKEDDVYPMVYTRKEKGHVKCQVVGDEKIAEIPETIYQTKKYQPFITKGYNETENCLEYYRQAGYGWADADLYYPLCEFDLHMAESEKYQAIHRARPFRKDKIPEIYVFGDIPDKLKEEFDVRSYNNRHTIAYLFWYKFKAYPIPLWQAVTGYYAKNGGLTSLEIARDFGLYKNYEKGSRSSLNTRLVTKIINGEITLKDVTKIHEAIKKDIITTTAKIKRRCRALKMGDEDIEDFVNYSQLGEFINFPWEKP